MGRIGVPAFAVKSDGPREKERFPRKAGGARVTRSAPSYRLKRREQYVRRRFFSCQNADLFV